MPRRRWEWGGNKQNLGWAGGRPFRSFQQGASSDIISIPTSYQEGEGSEISNGRLGGGTSGREIIVAAREIKVTGFRLFFTVWQSVVGIAGMLGRVG